MSRAQELQIYIKRNLANGDGAAAQACLFDLADVHRRVVGPRHVKAGKAAKAAAKALEGSPRRFRRLARRAVRLSRRATLSRPEWRVDVYWTQWCFCLGYTLISETPPRRAYDVGPFTFSYRASY